MPQSIPDWASVLGFLWAVAATLLNIWQRLRNKSRTDQFIAFLHGLKGGDGVGPKAIEQIDDMLGRFDPPKRNTQPRQLQTSDERPPDST